MFGYLAGDYVIKEVSRILNENTRGSDAIGRFKGDKLFIQLHQTDAHGIMPFERAHKALIKHGISLIEFL